MPGKYQSAHTKGARKTGRTQPTADPAGEPPLNYAQARIRQWLKQVRFRKAVLGGVSEADVWKKLGELNALYEAALSAERARYDALLEARSPDPRTGGEYTEQERADHGEEF